MIVLEPWSVNAETRSVIERGLKTLVGRTVASVDYLYPAGFSRSVEVYRSGFDIAEMQVAVAHTDGSQSVFSWLMDGAKEGLSVEVGVPEVDIAARHLQKVSASGAVISMVSTPALVSGVGVSWQELEDGLSGLWATRLQFESGESVTVALGDIADDGGAPSYQPDNLLVIHDETLARKFRIPSSLTPAWGDDL